VGRDENGEARRSEECRHELPRRFGVPRPPHHPRMRCDAQKLVKYPQIVYQASGRARWRSSQSRQGT
jgi:hypothetical protein